MIGRSITLTALVAALIAASPASAQSTGLGAQAPATASSLFELSRSSAVEGKPQAALVAIEQALALQPQNPEYLRSRATLATWLGDYHRAQDSYRRLAILDPQDVEIALSSARVSAWAGDTDAAVDSYRHYLALRPEEADVWLDLAKTESWRGNYAAAMEALDGYRHQFGVSPAYSRQLAAVMAGGGSPRRAEAMLKPLLGRTPDDYELFLTHTLALALQQRPREAFAALDHLRQLAPERPETQATERMLRTLLSSSADAQFTVYADSDRLQTHQFAPRADVALLSGTRFSAGYNRTTLDARVGSGLEQRNGSGSARYGHTWGSIAQKLGRVTLLGQGGTATAGAHDLTTYGVSADVRAADRLRFSLERAFGYFVVSPRTVGLQITQTGERLQVEWSPTLQSHVSFDSTYQELSDGNSRWTVVVSPRRSVARTARLNLDLGLSAYQLHTERDLANGYYDPRLYEQYAAVAYPYFKFNENVGLGLSVAMGAQRERQSAAFTPGGSVTAEATLGIYQPWVVKIVSGATVNRRLETGAFQGLSTSVALVRRF